MKAKGKAPVNLKLLLKQVNEIRADLGYSPRKSLAKGVPEDSRCCVIANSIPGSVDVVGMEDDMIWVLTRSGELKKKFKCKKNMSNFINRFDNCEFPELVSRWH
jgi:hypothetical protein